MRTFCRKVLKFTGALTMIAGIVTVGTAVATGKSVKSIVESFRTLGEK